MSQLNSCFLRVHLFCRKPKKVLAGNVRADYIESRRSPPRARIQEQIPYWGHSPDRLGFQESTPVFELSARLGGLFCARRFQRPLPRLRTRLASSDLSVTGLNPWISGHARAPGSPVKNVYFPAS